MQIKIKNCESSSNRWTVKMNQLIDDCDHALMTIYSVSNSVRIGIQIIRSLATDSDGSQNDFTFSADHCLHRWSPLRRDTEPESVDNSSAGHYADGRDETLSQQILGNEGTV